MAERHFYEQRNHGTSYLVPFFERHIPHFRKLRILEVGCAEGGFLDVLHEWGVEAMGLELSPSRVRTAKKKNAKLKIVTGDITDCKLVAQIGRQFDLIVMRDVLEHIPDRLTTFSNLCTLLSKDGYLYITFPPRFSPFAGHQQNGSSVLRVVPYLHLLPAWKIRMLGRIFKERPKLIETVVLNKRVGLTIGSFERLCAKFEFEPVLKELFLVRPIYKVRFGLTPRKAPDVPILREVVALSCECLLQKHGRQGRTNSHANQATSSLSLHRSRSRADEATVCLCAPRPSLPDRW